MHDPKTVAHEIYGLRGWMAKRRRDKGIRFDDKNPKFAWRSPIATIWHCDPELDGSDDSCGYSYPCTPRELREQAEKIAGSEWEFMFGKYAYKYQQPSAYEVIYAMWKIIAWRIFKRRSLRLHEFQEISGLAANPSDNLRTVVFDASRSPENAKRLGALVLRLLRPASPSVVSTSKVARSSLADSDSFHAKTEAMDVQSVQGVWKALLVGLFPCQP